jgi:hypothetical protein
MPTSKNRTEFERKTNEFQKPLPCSRVAGVMTVGVKRLA